MPDKLHDSYKIGEINHYFAIVIVSTTSQVCLVKPIIDLMKNRRILIVNEDKYIYCEYIEKILRDEKLPFHTIKSFTKKEVFEIINSVHPELVIVCNDQTPISNLFIRIAKGQKIPTLLIQDGLLNTEYNSKGREKHCVKKILNAPRKFSNIFLRGKYGVKDLYKLIYLYFFKFLYGNKDYGMGGCDKISVFGISTKNYFVKRGLDPSDIVVTGSPKFDKYIVVNNYHKTNEKKTILLLTQPFVLDGIWTNIQREEFFSFILSAINDLDNVKLIVKLHPRENEDPYNKILLKFVNIIDYEIIKNDYLPDLLDQCDSIITVSSTAGIDALCVGKPLIIIDLFNNGSDLFNESGAVIIRSKLEVISKLKDSFKLIDENNSTRNTFLTNLIHSRDGKAANRIVDLINKLTQKDNAD